MKVLSIKSYYAYLICLGIKDIENRTWSTDYRGNLLIHSSGFESWELELGVFPKKWFKTLKSLYNKPEKQSKLRYVKKLDSFYDKIEKYYGTKDTTQWDKVGIPPYIKSQAIIGKVNLVDIVRDSKSEWAEKDSYHWVLQDAEIFKLPIMFIKGKLKLWNYNFK